MENFEQLASQYQPRIYKIIHFLNIYKNTDEFYQIGLIALWDAQKNYHEEKGSFSGFAFSWIKGKILNQLAKDKKQQERDLFPEEEFWEMAVDHHSNILFEDELFETYCQTLTEKKTKWLVKACYFSVESGTSVLYFPRHHSSAFAVNSLIYKVPVFDQQCN